MAFRRPMIFLALIGIACGSATIKEPFTPRAAAVLKCPEKDIESKELNKADADVLYRANGPQTVVAVGCGQIVPFARMCTVPSGNEPKRCDWYAVRELKEKDLRKRAAFDTQCTEDKLTFTDLDNASMGVVGCGHRLTYVWNCPHNPRLYSGACNWVLNTESKREL